MRRRARGVGRWRPVPRGWPPTGGRPSRRRRSAHVEETTPGGAGWRWPSSPECRTDLLPAREPTGLLDPRLQIGALDLIDAPHLHIASPARLTERRRGLEVRTG